MKNLEIKTIEHKEVKVTICIDYDRGQISLLEPTERFTGPTYSPKKWLFAERGLEYMQSWQNILDAMKYAIKEAEKDLRAYQKEKEELALELFSQAEKELNKKKKSSTPKGMSGH